jgi:hypothetical protein
MSSDNVALKDRKRKLSDYQETRKSNRTTHEVLNLTISSASGADDKKPKVMLFRILDLPLELRQRVYDFYLEDFNLTSDCTLGEDPVLWRPSRHR